MKTGLIVLFLLSVSYSWCQQRYPVTGQLPTSAFPVCGTDTFSQTQVPIGGTSTVTVPSCGLYPVVNPFWYTFTCYQSGTLGFVIDPNASEDDYDWMLFDITGHSPNDIFKDSSLVVTGNWAGTYAPTGAKAGGENFIGCGSDPADNVQTFSEMPNLIKGHIYLLLVSHYTDTQSGYKLSFGGGTADITNPDVPVMTTGTMYCNNKSLLVVLNKQVKCNSLASDGSDFVIVSSPSSIVSATGMDCNNNFDMDSIVLNFGAALAPGTYTLQVRVGSDDNTLLDDCGNPVAAGGTIPFTVVAPLPTPMDSVTVPNCAPQILHLVFPQLIKCSSAIADGSDFRITGSSPVSVVQVSTDCNDDVYTYVVNLILGSPIKVGGTYQIILQRGNDGNTLINECDVETPVGSSVSFTIKDTVSANFSYTINVGCVYDTIVFNYDLANGVNQWQWQIDTSYENVLLDPTVVFRTAGPKVVQHVVSNGFCSDSVSKTIELENHLMAAFTHPDEICPKDITTFVNTSTGHIATAYWEFGDGSVDHDYSPPAHTYPATVREKIYEVQLIEEDSLGCYDTASAKITRLQSCYIGVPNAFTPNGDGKNDYLYPLNAFSATNLEFVVYNRYGQRIFESRDPEKKWDGTVGGQPQPTGTYVWTLSYTDGPSGKRFFLRGTSVLIR